MSASKLQMIRELTKEILNSETFDGDEVLIEVFYTIYDKHKKDGDLDGLKHIKPQIEFIESMRKQRRTNVALRQTLIGSIGKITPYFYKPKKEKV